ncbi:PAS domain S-box-containing protein [Archangium gephyra]|uniref:histidine kinase n=1 Tax=Archangium gephyra TaxID=48 RepID=A0ABX9K832_9BACT|nr:ATP-binding protein [Archangium gephyra]REG35704.1 PAS domain S-box-containing protein [Archangium gephyra]
MLTRYARQGPLASDGSIQWEADAQTLRCLSVNEQARNLGFPREQWLGEERFLSGTVFAPDRELFLSACRAAARGARIQERCRARSADGRTRWMALTLEPECLGRTRFLRGRMVEPPPEGSVTRGVPPLIVAHFDRELRHLDVNRGVEEVTGLPVASFIGRTNEELRMPPRLVRHWHEELHRVFRREEGRWFEFEFPPREESGPQGRTLFRAHLEPVFDSRGQVLSVRCETYRLRSACRARRFARASPPVGNPEADRLRQALHASRAREAELEQRLQQAERRADALSLESRRQKGELQTLLELLPVGIGIAREPLCQHVQQNAWFARLLEVPLETNVSLSAPEHERIQGVRLLHEGRELRPEEMPLQRAAATGEKVPGMELELEVRGRRHTSLLASAAPLLDEAHQPRGAIVSFLDITSRTRAMEAQRFLADSSAALASSLEPEQTFQILVRLCVPGLASMAVLLGSQEEGTLGLLSMAHAEPELEPLLARAFQHFHASPAHPLHDVMRTGLPRSIPATEEPGFWEGNEDPEWWHVRQRLALRSVMLVPISSHQRVTNVLVLGSPERVYTQDDCTFAREFAAHAATALDNARLYHEARQAVAVRDEFLGIAGHELRTPLTALKLGLQNLSRQAEALGQRERLEKWLTNCQRQGERLGRLVNDLLDVGRLTSGRLALVCQEMELPALVEEVVGRMRPELERAGCRVSLALESPLTGSWDRSRLDQVLTNLLSNAAKYGKGRPIEIRASALPEDRVCVSVRDEGIGITPEDQARIFGRFERAVSERHYGGLGLGLWISQQLVVRFGGHIGVKSEPGKGATFTVELPRRVETEEGVECRSQTPSWPGQQKAAAAEALALMEGDSLCRTILAALWEGIVVQDSEGNIITANASAEHILGLSLDQLTGRTSMDPRWRAIREDGSDFPGQEHPAMVALRTGRPVRNVTMGIYRPDGSRAWLLVNAQPLLRDGEPAPYMVVASFFDMTGQRKQA